MSRPGLSRFNGFPPQHRKTVETVRKPSAGHDALLKGVNEKPVDSGGARPASSCTPALHHRFAKFAAVGAGGIIVQVITLAILLRAAPAHYLLATALAVEAAILHNFAWHMRWTWADRRGTSGILA